MWTLGFERFTRTLWLLKCVRGARELSVVVTQEDRWSRREPGDRRGDTHAAWSAWGNQAIARASTSAMLCTPRGRHVCMFCASACVLADAGCRQPRISLPADWRVLVAPPAARTRACAPASIDRGPAASFRSLRIRSDPLWEPYWATNALNALSWRRPDMTTPPLMFY